MCLGLNLGVYMALRKLFAGLGVKKTVIDWGTTAIKIAHSAKGKNGTVIKEILSLDPNEDLSTKFAQLWEKHGFSYSNVVLCVDGTETLIRIVDFPKVDAKSLKDSLGFELTNYTPFTQEEVYFDCCILQEESSADTMKVLIALAKKMFIDEKLAILEFAGIKPRSIILNPIVLTNALQFVDSIEQPIALFDLGHQTSMITIVHNGRIILSREIKKGAKDIFDRLQTVVDVKVESFADFEEHKHRITRSVLYDVTGEVTSEIKLSLDFIETRENLSVKKIMVSGGSNVSTGVWDVFSSVIGVETVSFDILSNLSMSNKVKKSIEEAALDYTVALSAAFQ